MFIYLKLKTLLALINSILGWSLNLSILLRIDSSYDESGEHLYAWFAIFKLGIFVKYSLNVLAIWSLQELIFCFQAG